MQKLSFILVFLLYLFVWGCSSIKKTTPPSPVKTKKKNVSNSFRSPLKTRYVVTQRFKPKKNRKHKGIDLAGKKGSPIFAVEKGRVVYAGSKFSGYGKMVLIEHRNGVSSLYSHFDKLKVKSGKRVHRGSLLGTMGRTGRATGVHLHFEIMENKLPVNPEKYVRFR